MTTKTMSQLAELQQKLSEQQAVVDRLASQVEHSAGGETRQLVRKQQQAVSAAQATQNNIGAILNRVAYLRAARKVALENLLLMDRFIASTRLVDPAKADHLEKGQTETRRAIDALVREMVKLGVPEIEGEAENV
jgi:hypothetical protein